MCTAVFTHAVQAVSPYFKSSLLIFSVAIYVSSENVFVSVMFK